MMILKIAKLMIRNFKKKMMMVHHKDPTKNVVIVRLKKNIKIPKSL